MPIAPAPSSAHRPIGLQARLLLAIFAMSFLGSGVAQAAEQLSITFTTSITGANYSPKNVHVVWIENSGGGFVKTIGRWAATRRNHLVKWYALATSADTDSVSGATQANAGTYTATWDMLPKGGGSPVADGVYTIKLELTCSNGGSPEKYAVFTFNKNGTASTQNPANQGGYSNITISYTGRPVVQPDINLSPSLVNFGAQAIGAKPTQAFNIQNLGGSDLNVTGLTLSGADAAAYALVSPPSTPFTVAPGGSRAITVQFSPDAQRAFNNAYVNVNSNSPSEGLVSVALNGSCSAPQVRLLTRALSFPATVVGDTATQAFAIDNLGAVPLHVDTLTPVGLDKSVFSIASPATPLTVVPSGSQTVTVRFAPTSDQAYTHAQIAVASDDPTQRVTTVSLTGNGTRAALSALGPVKSIPGPSRAVAMKNATTACVGQGAVLSVFDTTVATSPTRVGQVRLPGVIRRLLASGNTLYAAMGSAGLGVVSITDSANPQLATVLDTPGNACDLALAGQTLCVADGLGGLKLYSVSSPASPVAQSAWPTQGPAYAVAASGATVYVLDAANGLQILSLTNPASPSLLGSFTGVEVGSAIAYDSGKVYIATDNAIPRFHILNVQTPAAPQLLTIKPTTAACSSIFVTNNKAYLSEGTAGVEVFDVSVNPPTSFLAPLAAGEACDVAVTANVAAVAAGSGGLRLVNVASAGQTAELGADGFAAAPSGVDNAGSLAVIANGNAGVALADLSTTKLAKLHAVLGSVTEARAVAIAYTTAYLAAGNAGLKIVNIANPNAPAVLGTFKTDGYANSVAISGTTALVADGNKVYRVNVANPSLPTLDGSWVSDGYACGLAISEQYGYVANGGNGLRVLNLSGSGLSLAGSAPVSGVAYGVAISAGTAFVAAGASGLQIFNVQSPSSPQPLASFDMDGTAMGVAVRDTKCYVAAGEAGLVVVNVANPASPALDARSSAPLRAWSVSVGANRTLVGDCLGGPAYFLYVTAARSWLRYE